ncbi:response regulator [Paludibacterium purpuratum]|uniref:Two-component system OmpR family response regulator n=1 Tax=Paludibacterium purpuratum TaxID=1144873 RepID=A0A4R7B1V3_9NEIS|nr:response regulator [Paludibacterium purpuratum]TDR73927.1 two-component system OmpR family response regulator [Paludibacterium purpuratum]
MPRRILLVDDDPELTRLLSNYLHQQGYQIEVAEDGEAMRAHYEAQRPDMIILDLMLPGEDGLSLCRTLRGTDAAIPILMLTARGDDIDRIIGLEMGADDYLPKPFNPRELLARIKSILRRSQNDAASSKARQLAFAGWILDLGARHLIGADGVVVPLTGAEFTLLSLLAEYPNQVLSRDQLLDGLAGREASPFDRTVDVLISRIRRRLGDDARDPQWIKTVRNGGYILVAPVERIA